MEKLSDSLRSETAMIGIMLSEIASPNMIRLFQQAGFQYTIVDNEHGSFDFSQLSALAGLASGYGFPLVVRVPGISREQITKVLDMGARGILVPMVNTPEQARQVVAYSKYTPVGQRGISTTRAHTNYNPPPLAEYLRSANQNTWTMVQLETAEAIKNAEGIAGVEGVDAVLIGPNDLSADLGTPGQVNSAGVRSAAEKVAAAGRKTGKPVGMITGNQELIRFCRQLGFTLFSVGSELDLLLRGGRERVEQFRELCKHVDKEGKA